MARRFPRRNQPEDILDHHFLQVLQNMNDETRSRYLNKLSLLLTKEFDSVPSFDWGLTSQIGLDELTRNFLQYTYLDTSGVYFFVCKGWDRLFKIQEPIYQEFFFLEFHFTVSFDPRDTPNDITTFSFQLGGLSRECSAIKLSIRVGIYTTDEMKSVHFSTLLVDCVRRRPADYNENTFWAEINGRLYTPSTARGKIIRSTTSRLLHRLISISLTHYKNSERVPSTYLFFL
ncbi:unnamed protein product [Lactuca saligna]|uniref:Uncharacterized protein n=1 Tax=Lactuca saligna TaxID=75948 RepID=A0AA35YZU2_LACSI|nr:unnamed protein product [Lactuca saligna]